MKLLLLLIIPAALSQLGQTPPQQRKTFFEMLEKEPWYFCDADSLWTYDKHCRPIRCTDPSVVKKLRVETVLEEVYLEGYDAICTETDSIVPGKTWVLTASRLGKLAYPLNSFGNLLMLDVSDHYFNRFPVEVFDLPQLKVLNISALCRHDICECMDRKDSYGVDFAPYHARIRQLLLVRHDPDFSDADLAVFDSINSANGMIDHETLFGNPMASCLSYEKRHRFNDVYLRPVSR